MHDIQFHCSFYCPDLSKPNRKLCFLGSSIRQEWKSSGLVAGDDQAEVPRESQMYY